MYAPFHPSPLQNPANPPTQHVIWHETFLPMTGGIRVWVNGEPRDLQAGDFAMVPGYQNHSYQFIAQETEFMGMIQPAGFDEFFYNVSEPWSPEYSVPFPPDQALAFPQEAYGKVVGKYDINLINKTYTAPECVSPDWHHVNGSLPKDGKTPYFLANGEGPHHWNEDVGAVVSPLATAVQSDGNFTLAQVVMRKTHADNVQPSLVSPDHQFIYGMNGEVTVCLCGEEVRIIKGDSLFIPAGTNFTLSSSVNYNKFLLSSGGPNGIDTQMIQAGKDWAYSTPPAY